MDKQEHTTFIGIDVAQGLKLTHQKHLQKRITQGQIQYLQGLNKSTWNKLMLKVMGSRFRKHVFDTKAVDGIPARVSLSLQWEQKISDTTRAGNRWIADNYNLPLEKYNYPL